MESWVELRAQAVLYEDESALVLDKPAGVSVMGERHGTDLVRLAGEAGEALFPAHRIDKATSGAILFAKDLSSHGALTRQFNKRTVAKAYLAITRGSGLPERGTIDLPLSVGRKNRVRVAANRADIGADIAPDGASGRWSVPPTLPDVKAYPSMTRFARVWQDGSNTLLAAAPETGRRHQIRVHLAWIGYPILGDPLFSGVGADPAPRAFLHSWRLSFDAAGGRVEVVAPPGSDFWAPLADRLPADLDQRLAGVDLARPRQAPARGQPRGRWRGSPRT